MDFKNLFPLYSDQFISIMIIHLFAVVSPGPDFLVVTKQSFNNGRSAAVFTSIGIAIGILVHVLYCLLGIGYIISVNQNLFNLLKIIGGIYLCYIGLKSLFYVKKTNNDSMKEDSRESILGSFLLGFITNVFNPKATLFFLSLFTLVIEYSTPIFVQLFYGLWMSIMTCVWFCLVSFFFTSSFSIVYIKKYSTLLDKIMGIILIFISIRIILF